MHEKLSLDMSNESINTPRQTKQFNLRPGDILKRGVDIAASFCGLLFLAPFLLLVAWWIRRDSPGPAYYRGERVGKGGKVFKMFKFRTMRESPESYDGPPVTAGDDPRITPLGRWLRITKINELPQLWNVLKGEMSLVGPRPEVPEIVAGWLPEVRAEILSVRPGITSPASVTYRHEEKLLNGHNVMDDYLGKILPDKLRLDLLYVRTRSFTADLDIIAYTLVALFPRLMKQPIPEIELFSGILTKFVQRYFSWSVLDVIVAFVAISLAGVIARLNAPLDVGVPAAIGLAIIIALLFGLLNYFLGLGRISWRSASPAYVIDLAVSSFLATVVFLLFNIFEPFKPSLPVGVVIDTGIFAFSGFVIIRYRQRLLTGLSSRWLELRKQKKASTGEQVLIVGAGECGQLAVWLLQKSNLAGSFHVVGMVDDNPHAQGQKIDGHTVIGSTRDIPALVAKLNIGVILFAINRIGTAEKETILAQCRALPVHLVLIPDVLQGLQEQFMPNGDSPSSQAS
jgi:lipopolysaccharide/colanic/teichoic acid biosynthesis glycosyltransferase